MEAKSQVIPKALSRSLSLMVYITNPNTNSEYTEIHGEQNDKNNPPFIMKALQNISGK